MNQGPVHLRLSSELLLTNLSKRLWTPPTKGQLQRCTYSTNTATSYRTGTVGGGLSRQSLNYQEFMAKLSEGKQMNRRVHGPMTIAARTSLSPNFCELQLPSKSRLRGYRRNPMENNQIRECRHIVAAQDTIVIVSIR